jgi:peptidoglycan/xylan/chitin deacetylase (PgdA/CDA1 family)
LTYGARPRLIVSITADDTVEDQFTNMAPTLEANGIRGNFFVNSSRIDLPGGNYLTTDELKEMQTVGHEIGAHGLMHLRLLETVTPAPRISREVCDSRVDLLARGFDIRVFAYPFGEANDPVGLLTDGFANLEARRCGYNAARGAGNLSASGLSAETIPPGNPYMLRVPSSVNIQLSLAQVQQFVLDAENNQNPADPSPPWLIINFHHICPGAACNPLLAWDTGLFGQFTSWLAARKPQGTIVRTISHVITGPINPPVASGTPLVLNGDFESYLNGNTEPPDCWLGGGTGNNTATTTQVAGRSGFGWQLVMSNFVDGSRAIIQDRGTLPIPDYRSCGTQVTPGHSYTFTCWYQSDVPTSLIFYENDNKGHARKKWLTSPKSPASPGTWASISYTATAASEFTTVFFGPFINEVCGTGCLNGDNTATVIVDDCSATDNG